MGSINYKFALFLASNVKSHYDIKLFSGDMLIGFSKYYAHLVGKPSKL